MSEVRDLRTINKPRTENEYIAVHTIIDYKQKTGQHRVYDLYIDDVSYNQYKVVDRFEDLTYKRGNGIVVKRDKERVISTLRAIRWRDYTYNTLNGSWKLNRDDVIRAFEEHYERG